MSIPALNDSGINRILTKSWEYYRENMITSNGRPLGDPDDNDLDLDGNKYERMTFSETCAYVLMRAVWMKDKETFNKVWNWTKNNLQRRNISETYTCRNDDCRKGNWQGEPNWKNKPERRGFADHLFAWRWIPSLNGIVRRRPTKGGIIDYEDLDPKAKDRSGINAASDDVEIAVALYFAWHRWNKIRKSEFLRFGKVKKSEFKKLGNKQILIWNALIQAGYINRQGELLAKFDGVEKYFKLKLSLSPTENKTIFNILYQTHIPIWNALMQAGYMNQQGELLPKFDGIEENFNLNLPLSSKKKKAIFNILRQTREAVEYLKEARAILKDAWEKYVRQVGTDRYYFFAGDQFSWQGKINPSYLRPAYFSRIFPRIDPDHPWHKVSDSSYEVIIAGGRMALGKYQGNKGLPPNWVDIDHEEYFVESHGVFSGAAGSIFGWDAVRTPFGIAQDLAWYGNNEALRYLTDCSVGPMCFLRNRPAYGLNHDGSRVRPRGGIPQSLGLTSIEFQLTMYGSILPAYYYGGDRRTANRIIRKIKNLYHGGYWGKLNIYDDLPHYYSQNWVAFGLMLVNHQYPPGLEKTIRSLPAIVEEDGREALLYKLPLLTPDPTIGTRRATARWRATLNRNELVDNLEIGQIQETLAVLTRSSHTIFNKAKHAEMFTALRKIDKKYAYSLLPYFVDPREFWNNVIIFLSAAAQKMVESNLTEDIEKAVDHCRKIRQRIASQKQISKYFLPHTYSQIILDHTEAKLRARVTKKSYDFYRQGRQLEIDVIGKMLSLDPRQAAPDYFVIIEALVTIGDFYLRMHEVEKRTHDSFLTEDYMDKAQQFYRYAALAASSGVDIEPPDFYRYAALAADSDVDIHADIDPPDEELYLSITPQIIKAALAANRRKGHISDEQVDTSSQAVRYLNGIAVAKDAALYIRRSGVKTIAGILKRIEKCDDALLTLELNSREDNDFFTSFAQVTKADLLLALADRITFDLWPENGVNLPYISSLLAGLEKRFKIIPPNTSSDKKSIIRRIHVLKKHIITKRATKLYRRIPSKFDFLYAASWIKRVEIAVRTAHFINREFAYLYPFYTHRVFAGDKPAIPDDEFLGIARAYLKALLLTSTKRKRNMAEAVRLFNQVKALAHSLPHPYPTYFEVHANLKLAQIYLKAKNKKKARELFKAVEAKVKTLTPRDFELMAWRPYSLQAELYQEMANAGINVRRNAIRALEMCYRSDSEYDFHERRQFLLIRWDWLHRYARAFSRKYGR